MGITFCSSGTSMRWLSFHCVHIKLEFGYVGFCGEGKTGISGEKPSRARLRTSDKLNAHMTPSLGIKPLPYWWEASALNTVPSPLPAG